MPADEVARNVLVSSDPGLLAERLHDYQELGFTELYLHPVGEDDDEIGWLSLRNLPNVHPIAPDQLNTYDVLVNDDVVFTSAALESFLVGPARGMSAKAGQNHAARSSEAAATAATEESQ